MRPLCSIPYLVIALLAAGCGGSSSTNFAGGTTNTGTPSATLVALGPTSSDGSPVTGFDASGKPVFAAPDADAGAEWDVYASSTEKLYTIAIPGATGSRVMAIDGAFVAGSYEGDSDSGTAVAVRSGSSVTVAKYPGYDFCACQGGLAVLADDATGAYSVLDMASGKIAAEPIPTSYTVLGMNGRFVLCAAGLDRSKRVAAGKASRAATRDGVTGAYVWDLRAHGSTALSTPSGSNGIYPGCVNANGQVLGVSYEGTRTNLRLWQADGSVGSALDGIDGGYVEPGWLSPDGARMAYGMVPKDGSAAGTAYMLLKGTRYTVTSPQIALAALYGLNDAGTLGFADDQGTADSFPNVDAVKITYR